MTSTELMTRRIRLPRTLAKRVLRYLETQNIAPRALEESQNPHTLVLTAVMSDQQAAHIHMIAPQVFQ